MNVPMNEDDRQDFTNFRMKFFRLFPLGLCEHMEIYRKWGSFRQLSHYNIITHDSTTTAFG